MNLIKFVQYFCNKVKINNEFYKNIITRRNIVQVIYQNQYCYNCDIEYYLSLEYEFGRNILNRELFLSVIKKYFEIEGRYDILLSKLSIDCDNVSYVSYSVIKAFIAEYFIFNCDSKILMNDYINISKVFCSEYKIINKILDIFCKNNCLDLDCFLKI